MRLTAHIPRGITPKILLVGDHPGFTETKRGVGFQGFAYQDLKGLLNSAGIDFNACAHTYVFSSMPPGNTLLTWAGSKREVQLLAKTEFKWPSYNYPAVIHGKYMKPYYLLDLLRLQNEIQTIKPNLVIALGSVPLWALCNSTGIGKHRGTITESTLNPGQKILPVFSPAASIAQYQNRVILAADLLKAAREQHFPELRRPKRTIYVAETVQDITEYAAAKLQTGKISVDLETLKARFISCIGFAPSPQEALVIPIISSSHDGKVHRAYWPSRQIEHDVWTAIAAICSNPKTEKILQNGLYDVQYLQSVGIPLMNFKHDTMLFQHALYPELPKALGFLGSIHTDEVAWKTLRPRGQKTEFKREL